MLPVNSAADSSTGNVRATQSTSRHFMSVYQESEQEILMHKWLESQKAG